MTQAYLEVLCKQRFLSIITNLWLFQEICLNGITNYILALAQLNVSLKISATFQNLQHEFLSKGLSPDISAPTSCYM